MHSLSSAVISIRPSRGTASLYAVHSIRDHEEGLCSRHRPISLTITDCLRSVPHRGHSVHRPPAKSQMTTPTAATNGKQTASPSDARPSAMREYCMTFAKISNVNATGPRTTSTLPRPRHRAHVELDELESMGSNSTGQPVLSRFTSIPATPSPAAQGGFYTRSEIVATPV